MRRWAPRPAPLPQPGPKAKPDGAFPSIYGDMETFTLKLRGKNETGGEIYRSYYIVTDGGRLAGRGRASAIPMSKGAPMPPQDFIEVGQGGEEEAVLRMLNTLLSLPGNHGLVAEFNDTPS